MYSRDITVSNRGQQIIQSFETEAFQQLCRVRILNAESAKITFVEITSGSEIFLVVLLPKPMAHLVPRPPGLQISQMQVEPISARATALGRQDFDFLAGVQHMR